MKKRENLEDPAVSLGTKMPNDRNVSHYLIIGWKMVNCKLSPCWTTIEEVSKALGELQVPKGCSSARCRGKRADLP